MLLLLGGAVDHQRLDPRLGQQRAQRERHARRGDHFLDCDPHRHRQSASAPLGGHVGTGPPCVGEPAVGLFETIGCDDVPLDEPRSLLVAHSVERCDHLGEEPPRFLEKPPHRVRIGMLVPLEAAQTLEIAHGLEDKEHVPYRRCVRVGHGPPRVGVPVDGGRRTEDGRKVAGRRKTRKR